MTINLRFKKRSQKPKTKEFIVRLSISMTAEPRITQ